MHAKTMEGLIGARTNVNMTNVPMRVYKEARRKGDLATMERSMGYVSEFQDHAYDYKDKAEEGMEDEAKENREKEKLKRQEEIENRREERKEAASEIEAKMQENREHMQTDPGAAENGISDVLTVSGTNGLSQRTETPSAPTAASPADTVEISAEGQALSKEISASSPAGKPVFYSSTGVETRMSKNESPKLNVSV